MPNLEVFEKVNTETVPAMVAAFGAKVETAEPTRDEIPQVFVAPDALLDVAQWLKNCGFTMLVDVAGADYYPNREPRFDVVYHLRNLADRSMIRLRVRCTEKDAVPTLSNLWPGANAPEREIYDQFGITFKNHPNLKRILNPDDWEGHPLRRDYPLRGPRGLITLEMPADENRYHPFVTEPSPDDQK